MKSLWKRVCFAALALATTMLMASAFPAVLEAQGEEPQDPTPPDQSADDEEDLPPPDVTPRANNLVEAETSYRGALILRGGKSLDDPDTDIAIGGVSLGEEGDPATAHFVGKFIGNTLNAEASDKDGNHIVFNAEFYWFESSIDRGSDFFVAVVKAVNSPNRAEKWVLEHSTNGTLDFLRPDHGAVLELKAETNPELNYGGFRFDWSIPKDDIHLGEVGNITMTAAYGAGLQGEGSAQYAYSDDYSDSKYCEPYMGAEKEYGCTVGAGTQVNGNLDLKYSVNTKYEVKLYTWDMYSDLTPTTMKWTMFLRNNTAQTEKAYYEFFITMQTPEGEEFRINNLELKGAYKKPKWGPWPDDRKALSVSIKDIVFRRPKDALQRARTFVGGDGGVGEGPATDDPFGYGDDSFDGEPKSKGASGCGSSVVGLSGATPSTAWLSVLGLVAVRCFRRRAR